MSNDWHRLTVGEMIRFLSEGIEAGKITTDTILFSDSDPEGNDIHPLRTSVTVAVLDKNGMVDLDSEPVYPAPVICFGVGY